MIPRNPVRYHEGSIEFNKRRISPRIAKEVIHKFALGDNRSTHLRITLAPPRGHI